MEPELIEQAKAELVAWLRRKKDAQRPELTVGNYNMYNQNTTASKCSYLQTKVKTRE